MTASLLALAKSIYYYFDAGSWAPVWWGYPAGASAEERAHKSLLAQVSEGLFVALTEVKI